MQNGQKHEKDCPMLQGQGAACTCGIPQDPYPPFNDAEIERLDQFYAADPSGINANERRLLANIREMKAELAELRASRVVPPNPNPPAYRGPDVKPQWMSPADTRVGELGGPQTFVDYDGVTREMHTTT